jgi:hypothetical protein
MIEHRYKGSLIIVLRRENSGGKIMEYIGIMINEMNKCNANKRTRRYLK